MFDVVALGELLVDFTTLQGHETETQVPGDWELDACGDPRTSHAPTIRGDAGGAPANVLAAVSKLGGSTAFIGKVGDDGFGSFLQASLQRYGIDTSGLRVSEDELTTLAFVTLTAGGERSFTFRRSPGADTTLTSDEVDVGLIADARIFHFGSLSLTHEPARSATLYAARAAKQRGALVSYDPNWRPPLWPDVRTGVSGMQLGLELADIIKVSAEEMELLTGTPDIEHGSAVLAGFGARAGAADGAEGAAKVSTGPGATLVVVTRGAEGAYFRFSGSNVQGVRSVPSPVVEAVDTTGAGDGFLGGLLWRIARATNETAGGAADVTEAKASRAEGGTGQPLHAWSVDQVAEAVRFANSVGAYVASRSGTMSAMPNLNDVTELLA